VQSLAQDLNSLIKAVELINEEQRDPARDYLAAKYAFDRATKVGVGVNQYSVRHQLMFLERHNAVFNLHQAIRLALKMVRGT